MIVNNQNFDESQKRNADRLESRVEKFLAPRGWKTIKIDNGKSRHKIPDYLCYRENSDTVLYCECKVINSNGTTERGVQITSLDRDYTDKYLFKNGAIVQMDYDKLNSKLYGLATGTKRKKDDFYASDTKYRELYENSKIITVLCIDTDTAFKDFVKPTVITMNESLGKYVDGVLLYKPYTEEPRELISELDSLGDSGVSIKEIGSRVAKYSNKLSRRANFITLPTNSENGRLFKKILD